MAATGGNDGLLSEARHRLGAVVATLDRLSDETAWECAAAREYRASLADLVAQVGSLRDDVIALEYDVRAAWLQTAAGGW